MSKCIYNPFTHNLGPEAQFESSDNESDTKDDRTMKTNIKEGGNSVNGILANPDVEMVDLPGYIAPQGFESESDEEGVVPKFIDMLAFPKGASIHYISAEATKLFFPKGV